MREEKKKARTSVRVPATKVESEKVTIMVGTFLKEDGYNDDFQALAMKGASKKVAIMVGTFWVDDIDDYLYQPPKRHKKR